MIRKFLFALCFVCGLAAYQRAYANDVDCLPYIFTSCNGPTPNGAIDIYGDQATTGIFGGCNRIFGDFTGTPHGPWDVNLDMCFYPYGWQGTATVHAGNGTWAWLTSTEFVPTPWHVNYPGVPGPKKAGDSLTYEPGYDHDHFPGINVMRLLPGETKTIPFPALAMIVRNIWLPDPPACVPGTTPWVYSACLGGIPADNGRADFQAQFGTARLSGTRPDGTTGAPCLQTLPGTSSVVTVVYDCNSRL